MGYCSVGRSSSPMPVKGAVPDMMMIEGYGAATLMRALPLDRLNLMSKAPPSTGTRYRTILLLGAPGSGKGTQGKIIGNIPGFHHNATGDIFRSLDLQSEMGRKFWEYAGRGELVPDEFTIKLWKQFIKGLEMVNQFHPETEFLVLDGIPRNLAQARLLEDTLDVILIRY